MEVNKGTLPRVYFLLASAEVMFPTIVYGRAHGLCIKSTPEVESDQNRRITIARYSYYLFNPLHFQELYLLFLTPVTRAVLLQIQL